MREAGIGGAVFRRSLDEVKRLNPGRRFDLILCHYSLSELGSDGERARMIERLWDLVDDNGIVVFLEKGNRWGFHCVRMARDGLLGKGRALARLAVQRDIDADPLENASNSLQETNAAIAPPGEDIPLADANNDQDMFDHGDLEPEPKWEAPPSHEEPAERVPILGLDGRRRDAELAVERAKEAQSQLVKQSQPPAIAEGQPSNGLRSAHSSGIANNSSEREELPVTKLPKLPLTGVGPSGAISSINAMPGSHGNSATDSASNLPAWA